MRALALASLLCLTAAGAPGDARRYMVTGFDRVRINGPFEVEIVPGNGGASAEGDPAALDRLSLQVQGSTLIVNSGASGFAARKHDTPRTTRIRIATPLLRGIVANGGAAIHVSNMRAPRIDLSLEGTGSLDVAAIRADELFVAHNGMGMLKLSGTATSLRIRGAVGGTVDGSGLLANDATLLWESYGPLVIGVRYTAQVTASGHGSVTILGNPECKVRGTATISCAGEVIRR